MTEVYRRLLTCADFVRARTDIRPEAALVLGSGLGSFADTIDVRTVLPYGEIPDFPVSHVEGHKGQFVFGYAGDLPVVIMQGRVHYYEGYSMEDVVLPIRVMKMLGAETLILTNAAGGVNRDFDPGDLMLITDQISLVPSPLIGPNPDELGERFCDMTYIYDRALQELVREAAQEAGITLREGVYIQFSGPNYETPAEVRMARTLGADAVGMSTACEAVAANHMNMKICGISCITNPASGITDRPLTHSEVQQSSNRAGKNFQKLLRSLLSRIR